MPKEIIELTKLWLEKVVVNEKTQQKELRYEDYLLLKKDKRFSKSLFYNFLKTFDVKLLEPKKKERKKYSLEETLDYIDNVLLPKKKKNIFVINPETGEVEVKASIPLYKIIKLGLSDADLIAVFEHLNDEGIIIRGHEGTLDFENYNQIINYKRNYNQTYEWDEVKELFIRFDLLKKQLKTEKDEIKIEKLKQQYKDLRSELVVKNMRLAEYFVITRFSSKKYDMEELKQFAYVCLFNYVENYDVNSGYKFSSYLYRGLFFSMMKLINNEKNLIKIPETRNFELKKVKKLKSELEASGKTVTSEELVDPLGFSLRKLNNIQSCDFVFEQMPDFSFEEYPEYQGEGEYSYADADDTYDIVDYGSSDALENVLNSHILDELFQNLNPREIEVIELRFGLNGKTEKSLEEISLMFGLSKERIRQIEENAIIKLRKAASKKKSR